MGPKQQFKLKKNVFTDEELKKLFGDKHESVVKINVEFALVGEKYPVEDFINGLEEVQRKKIIKLFAMMMKYGEIKNTDNFKRLKKGVHEVLFEFKPDQTIRLGCVKDDGGWLLLLGIKKKRGDWVDRDFTKFENNYAEYLNEKNARANKKGNHKEIKPKKSKLVKRKK